MVTNKGFQPTPKLWSGPVKGAKVMPRFLHPDLRVEGNYVGPFNRTDLDYQRKYPPINERDYIAYKHDLYPEPYEYTRFNNADVDFLKDIKNVRGPRARLYEGYFKFKRAFFPHHFLPRNVSRGPSIVAGDDPRRRRYRRRRRRRHVKKFVRC